MRILLANPNTTEGITQGMAEAGRAVASPGTVIKAVTSDFGAQVIGSRMEMVIGDYAAMELVAREGEGCDAVIIAAAIDSGLRAIRQMMPCPVIGLTEAALHTACLLGSRFGMVVSSGRVSTVMREMVSGYGLASRLAGMRWLGLEASAIYADPGAVRAEIARCATELAEQDQAEVVILIGAVMAGMPAQVQAQVPVPVIEGVTCAVPLAEALARMRPHKPSGGSFALPKGRGVAGLGPALTARFAG